MNATDTTTTDARFDNAKNARLLGIATGTVWTWAGDHYTTTRDNGTVQEARPCMDGKRAIWVGVARHADGGTGARWFPSLKQLLLAL